MKELLEEEIKKAQQRRVVNQKQIEDEYAKQVYINQQKMLDFLNVYAPMENGISENVLIQSMQSAIVIYEKNSNAL